MIRINRRKQYGNGVIQDLLQKVGKEFDPQRPPFPNEMHATMLDGPQKGFRAQYLGPFTQVQKRLDRGDKGINDLDRSAKKHDESYLRIGKKLKNKEIDKKEFNKEINVADKIFIAEAKKSKDAPITGNLASKAIVLKSLAEQYNIIPSTVFSGGEINCNCDEYRDMKLKLFTPDHELRKEMNKQKGGLAPLVVAFLSAMAPSAIEGMFKLGKLAVKKLKGGGSDIHRNAALVLEKLPEAKQLDLLGKTVVKYGKEAFI